jgi:hypothetical protein
MPFVVDIASIVVQNEPSIPFVGSKHGNFGRNDGKNARSDNVSFTRVP